MPVFQQQHLQSHGIVPKPQPALNTLPSELRRVIVSYLAPNPNDSRLGVKSHLKSANLAHSCLREWVPEYMFRDMALKHVLVGMSSHLERFAATTSNAGLFKFVKHISVQVPPALRWEIGSDNPFAHHLAETTTHRLKSKFRVGSEAELTDEERQYCSDYHRAMVEPFTDNRSWYRLLRAASDSWAHVFSHFKNLEEISVACCEIVDQPAPTYTHTFVLQHGRDVVSEPDPPYVEDETVNMAWASAIVLNTAPPTVRSMNLSMANLDNFNSFATINRLLSMSHRPSLKPHFSRTTRLCLDLRGIAGAHGNQDEHGDTGSAGSVRHWINALNSLRDLRYLELQDAMNSASELQFTDMGNSDSKKSILDWILPDLDLRQLCTLHLGKFLLDTATIQMTFGGNWPKLEDLILQDLSLMKREQDIKLIGNHVEHLQGASWLETCRALIEKRATLRISLVRPASNVNDATNYSLHSTYIELLNDLPQVDLAVPES